MAAEKKKTEGASKKGSGDRKRLAYLKIRAKDLKAEMTAAKKEMLALRQKLGVGKKAGGDDDADE